jgi:hypothetical protein
MEKPVPYDDLQWHDVPIIWGKWITYFNILTVGTHTHTRTHMHTTFLSDKPLFNFIEQEEAKCCFINYTNPETVTG